MAESSGQSNNCGVNSSCTTMFLVRHGETEWNTIRKIQGHLDVDLNETGRQQAVAVANRLAKEPNISTIYSSDLKRALETANIIASKCDRVQVVKDQELRERHLGDLQGHIFDPVEMMRACPVAYNAFVSNNKNQEIPGGGESINQLYQRCTSALQRISERHKGETLVVVSHGGVIRSLYERATHKGHPGKVLNASVSVIHIKDRGIWTLEKWNDVSHLNQTMYLKSGFGGDATSG